MSPQTITSREPTMTTSTTSAVEDSTIVMSIQEEGEEEIQRPDTTTSTPDATLQQELQQLQPEEEKFEVNSAQTPTPPSSPSTKVKSDDTHDNNHHTSISTPPLPTTTTPPTNPMTTTTTPATPTTPTTTTTTTPAAASRQFSFSIFENAIEVHFIVLFAMGVFWYECLYAISSNLASSSSYLPLSHHHSSLLRSLDDLNYYSSSSSGNNSRFELFPSYTIIGLAMSMFVFLLAKLSIHYHCAILKKEINHGCVCDSQEKKNGSAMFCAHHDIHSSLFLRFPWIKRFILPLGVSRYLLPVSRFSFVLVHYLLLWRRLEALGHSVLRQSTLLSEESKKLSMKEVMPAVVVVHVHNMLPFEYLHTIPLLSFITSQKSNLRFIMMHLAAHVTLCIAMLVIVPNLRSDCLLNIFSSSSSGDITGSNSCLMSLSGAVMLYMKVVPLYTIFVWMIHVSQNLRKSQVEKSTMMEAMLMHLPAMVWAVDSEMIYTFCKGAGLKRIGGTPEDYEGRPLYQPSDKSFTDEPVNVERHRQALKGENVGYDIIADKFQFSAALAPLKNESSNVVGVIGVAFDVTDIVKAKNDLLASEEHYRSLVEQVDHMILKIDKNYVIQFSNRDFLDIEKNDLVGRSFVDLFQNNVSIYEEMKNELGQLFSNGHSRIWEWEHESRYFSVRASTIGNPVDGYTAAMILIIDTTEHNLALENERYVTEKQIELRSKSQLLFTISHELLNPLNCVVGSLQLLALDGLTKSQAELVNDAKDNAGLLLGMISDVLHVSRLDSSVKSLVSESSSILDIVESVGNMISSQAHAKGLIVNTYVETDIPDAVKCDRHRIVQILLNYALNSVKFTDSGYIKITCSKVTESKESVTLRFECIDTGIGVKKEDQSVIFEPYVQLPTPGNIRKRVENMGWGLGLPICSHLASLMKGSVGVISEVGQGATFHFQVELNKSNESDYTAPVSGTRRIRDLFVEPLIQNIIVFEDSEPLCKILQKYFEELSIPNVIFASTQREVQLHYEAQYSSNSMVAIVGPNHRKHLIVPYASSACRVIITLSMEDRSNNVESIDSSPLHGIIYLRKPIKLISLLQAISIETLSFGAKSPFNPFSLSIVGSPGSQPLEVRELRVLIVEDNAVNRKIFYRMLTKIGLQEIDVAADGLQGLELVRKRIESGQPMYDTVFMDLMMPVMSGFDSAMEMRRLLAPLGERSMSIVAVTANSDEETIQRCLSSSFDRFLTKPVPAEELTSLIKDMLRSIGARETQHAVPSEEL